MKKFLTGLGLSLLSSVAFAAGANEPLWGGDAPRMAYNYLQGAYYISGETEVGGTTIEYDHNSASGQVLLHENLVLRGVYLRQPTEIYGDDGVVSYRGESVNKIGEMLVMARVPLTRNPRLGLDVLVGAGYSRSAGDLGEGMEVKLGAGTPVTTDLGDAYISKGVVTEVGMRTDFGTELLDLAVLYRHVQGNEEWSESGVRTELGFNLPIWNLAAGYAGWFQRDEPLENIASVNRHGVFVRYQF